MSSSSFFLLSFLPMVPHQRLLPVQLSVRPYTRPGSCTLLAHGALDSLRGLESCISSIVEISDSRMLIPSVSQRFCYACMMTPPSAHVSHI